MREAHLDIARRKVSSMRNRLGHACFDVDLALIWRTVQEDVPALIAQLAPLVPPDAE
ncbi:MAG: DUF86 domain-containing protein [Bryobacterales bacterium]|nr:DUF86 domain-containing protein [Bryobacterales bacterium]